MGEGGDHGHNGAVVSSTVETCPGEEGNLTNSTGGTEVSYSFWVKLEIIIIILRTCILWKNTFILTICSSKKYTNASKSYEILNYSNILDYVRWTGFEC